MNPQPFDDPNWPRASAWLAGAHAENSLGKLAVLGAPLRLGSITQGRCDLAPAAVRDSLRKFSCYDIESDTDLHLIEAHDHGDLPLAETRLEDALAPLSQTIRNLGRAADAVIIIDGDT